MTTAAESIANTKTLLNEALNEEIVIVNRQMLRAFKKVVKEARKHVNVLIEEANETETRPPLIPDEQFKSELKGILPKIRDSIIEFLKKNAIRGIKFVIKAIPRLILEPIALLLKGLIGGMSAIGAIGFGGVIGAVGMVIFVAGTIGAALATAALATAALTSGAGLILSVAGAIASLFAGLISGTIIGRIGLAILDITSSILEIFWDIYTEFSYEINSELDNKTYVMVDKAIDNAFSKLLD